MISKILITVLLLLISCGGESNNKDRPPPPPFSDAVLVDFKPIKGTHIPLVQFVRHDALGKLRKVYVPQELVDTTSWLSFKGSAFGKNLIGAMFKNFDPSKDLHLWFKLQLTPTETVEYSLELTKRNINYSGYETLKIGNKEKTEISVTFQIIPKGSDG
tara:strand:+ start:3684 stop:4160 length:477 start_codon:yes stop_codon:yes gene_type:complete